MATGCEPGQVRKEAAATATLGIRARRAGSATRYRQHNFSLNLK